jgi:hypothetical protein
MGRENTRKIQGDWDMTDSRLTTHDSRFPIDLVYTWGDWEDPIWLAKKNAALLAAGKELPKSSTSANRWKDNDELLYSLRSAEKHAPWLNHIYIITDGTRPKWLNENNPKISVIDHAEIIPKELLPTFNSLAIELFLWNIPGLSEHFLYANDDMFFGRGVSPDFFFDEGGNPIVLIKERKMPPNFLVKKSWYMTRIKNAIDFVAAHFGHRHNASFVHAIEPIRKSFMRENFNQFQKEFTENTATQFREVKNIQRLVFPLIDNAKGRNALALDWRVSSRRMVHNYKTDCGLKRAARAALRRVAKWLGLLKYDLFSSSSVARNFSEKLRRLNPKTFCINDNKIPGQNFSYASEYMKTEFNKKSEYEK